MFQKGNKIWVGRKHTEETKRKMSLKLLGNTRGAGSKGRHLSEKQKAQISAVHKGKIISAEQRKLISEGNKNKVVSYETRKKMSELHKGEKSPFWRGGVHQKNSTERALAMESFAYRLWRKAVFERDNYTCIWCGVRSKKGRHVVLHADHIKPWCDYPALRLALDNGRTLCIDCHRKTDTYGGKVGGRGGRKKFSNFQVINN